MQTREEAVTQEHARVLIVDDDHDWCEAAQLALETEGIAADAVHSGDAAMQRLGTRHYDAAIVDVQMPGRWGVDVVRELRANRGGMPIIIATAAPTAAGVCAGLLAGADDEFFKCDSNEDMVRKLRRLWRERAH
jgi:DNA-binding response OmpR family regulator